MPTLTTKQIDDWIVAHRARTGVAAPQREVAPVPTIAAPAQTANQIDDWIPAHIIQYCYGTDPSQSKLLPRGGRRVGMLAIGKWLKNRYDAFATLVPPHLAALVKKLKERG